MKDEKETKRKLLTSAKDEFMEKGYMKASLRTICKNAGVTTGALYFFFKDKEDLFASLVEEPLNYLMDVMMRHYEQEIAMINRGIVDEKEHSDDKETALVVSHYMYQYYDEFQLLLLKSQGSRFEHCIDSFIEITDKHYRVYADYVSSQMGTKRIPDSMIHWFAHMQTDTFVYMLIHEPDEEQAKRNWDMVIRYFINGWNGLFKED